MMKEILLSGEMIAFGARARFRAESLHLQCHPLANPLKGGSVQVGDFVLMYPTQAVPVRFDIANDRIVEGHLNGSPIYNSQYTLEYLILASQRDGSRIHWSTRLKSSEAFPTPWLNIVSWAQSSGRLTITHMLVVDDVPGRHAQDAVSIVQFDCKE
jgi:hypothetical protein